MTYAERLSLTNQLLAKARTEAQQEIDERVLKFVAARPDETLDRIATRLDIGRSTLGAILRRAGIKRSHGRKPGLSPHKRTNNLTE